MHNWISRIALAFEVTLLCALAVGVNAGRGLQPEIAGRRSFHALRHDEPCRVEITGHRDGWRARYPGNDGRFDTNDDVLSLDRVHVPIATKIELTLKSADYIYTFSLPRYGVREIAVPDLVFRAEMCPTQAGRAVVVGDPLCGDSHELRGDFVVESRERFQAWLSEQSSGAAD